jgi:hypothetical protein
LIGQQNGEDRSELRMPPAIRAAFGDRVSGEFPSLRIGASSE